MKIGFPKNADRDRSHFRHIEAFNLVSIDSLVVQSIAASAMSAPTSNTHSITCPICHHTDKIHAGQLFNGLYTCPSCQTRLVICWSGHFVRDPFSLSRLDFGQILRRQSRPFSRILRDVGALKWFAALGAVALGVTLLSLHAGESSNSAIPEVLPFPDSIESLE
ncbi:hypothetical protein [Baaleninema simplex]|uniref:hypothetical protein n=1 Tax=Baaleninema simplex TaxID=2862350 RepID=UPI000348178E|nr:hypothetical protein [Baaleninema simplex]